MIHEANQHTALDFSEANALALTDFELGLVLGGNASDVTGGDSRGDANWSNSGEYRDGAQQLAGTIVAVAAAGVAIVTAPISFPLALGLAAITGAGFAVSAADATIDMRNASRD